MNPLFSVIAPVYNVQEYLPDFLDSVYAQTYRDFELILVDDGSTDQSGALCDAAAAADPRVIVVHEKNGGLAFARSAGFKASSGAYICHADSDDWLEPYYLETIHNDIVRYNSPDMLIYNYCENIGGEQRAIPLYLPVGYYDRQQLEEKIFPYMIVDPRQREFGISGIANTILTKPMKRELYDKWRLTDYRISVAEDGCASYPTLNNADSVYMSDAVLYHYRIRPASITTGTMLPKKVESLFLASAYLQSHISGTPAGQIPAWTMKQLTRVIYSDCSRSSFSDSVRHVKEAFSGRKEQLRAIDPAGFPLPSRLLLGTLRLRLYFMTVLLNRMLQHIRR